MLWNTAAQEQPANSTPPAPSSTRQATSNASATNYAPIVEETVKLVRAGVNPELIKNYIESWPTPYRLNATDIIALKDRGVPDDITTALLKRGATLSKPAPANKLQASARSGATPRSYVLDPEGYDYFQYYYLYPRTLAAANQRLFSPNLSYFSYYPYPYAAPFYSLPPGAFRHR